MKKFLFSLLILTGFLLSSAINIYAYTINDLIGDRIGVDSFELYGMDVLESGDDLIFDIYTNYPQSGVTVSNWHTFAGDLFFDFDGDDIYDHGIAFTNKEGLNPGSFYSISDYNTSNHYALSGYIYNKNIPVAIDSGILLGSADVFAWEDIAGSNPNYRWHMVLDRSYFPKGVDIDVLYSGASCANDYLEGSFTVTTPEPASMLLLLFGLAGSFFIKRKK